MIVANSIVPAHVCKCLQAFCSLSIFSWYSVKYSLDFCGRCCCLSAAVARVAVATVLVVMLVVVAATVAALVCVLPARGSDMAGRRRLQTGGGKLTL